MNFCDILRHALQIGQLNDVFDEYIRPPKYLAFRQGSEIKLDERMRFAFASCISRFLAVPVEGCPDEPKQRFVIECDVIPESQVCKEEGQDGRVWMRARFTISAGKI